MSKIKISIKGKHPSSILKEIIKRKINIEKIIEKENEYELIIEKKDYKKVKEIKTTYKIKIEEYYGLEKIKDIMKRYKLILLFIGIGISLIITLSNLILDIKIIHSNQEIINIVEKDLKEFGIKKYHFVVSNKKREEIKRKILEKEKERIEWLEIEKIGTVYQIKIEERKIKKEEEECTPRNLVARKNATIIEIESEKGEIKVKKNDYVEKNQVLISGFIYNKDKIVSKRCAIGKVYGEVWYKVKVNIPKYYEKKIKQEEITRNIKLKIGKKYYYFPKNNKNITEKEYNIIDSKIIPFSLSIEKRRNIKSKKKQYTYEELDKIAKLVVEKDFQKRLKEKEEILEKKVLKKMEFNSKIIVEVFLKVKEEITEVQSIEELNIDEINQETE